MRAEAMEASHEPGRPRYEGREAMKIDDRWRCAEGNLHQGPGKDGDPCPNPTVMVHPREREIAAALREAMAASRRYADNEHPADWIGNYTGKLNALLIDIASRLESGERPLLYPEADAKGGT